VCVSSSRGEDRVPRGPGAAEADAGLRGQAARGAGHVRDHGTSEEHRSRTPAGGRPGAGGEEGVEEEEEEEEDDTPGGRGGFMGRRWEYIYSSNVL